MVLNPSVFVLVLPANQANVLPALKPTCYFGIRGVVHGIDKVEPREGPNSGGSGVQQGDKNQRVACGLTCIGYLGHGKKTYDDMG